MSSYHTPRQNHLIAGKHGGVKIFCSPNAFPVYQQLASKSHNANYWATLIIRAVKGLKSGAVNSKDVFVRTSSMHQGLQDFQIVLPGCKVFAQRHDNGDYVISSIVHADDYNQLQKSNEAPGLHRANREGSLWKTEIAENNKVKNRPTISVVAVSDTGFSRPAYAAERVGPRIKKTVNSSVNTTGFDLFFTPGKGRIAGLSNLRQAMKADTDKSLNEASALLANIMKDSRKEENITWFADFGGVAILTQAMNILNRHNLKLKGHTLYLHRPTARKDSIYKLSQSLGMTVDRTFVTSNPLNTNELIGSGSLTLPFLRKQKEDSYTLLQMGMDIGKGITGGTSVWKAGAALATAASAAALFPASATVIGALGLAAKASATIPVVAAHMPNTTDRIMAKF
ncbi:hypothetical protein [Endozoicomonas sp.]|uniref:hypothetical protein n=1 Tax=Endozoicomonas sp. TaxID=1892382 RepID=UPI003D9B0344